MALRPAPTARPAPSERIGFFGKLPSHGDFISEGLGRETVTMLDGWLRAGLHACEQEFGAAWQKLFMTSPPWRFIVERGVWGESGYAGVMLPSRDRVGRSFPLLILARLQGFVYHPRALFEDETWFMAAEGLAESSSSRDFDISRFTESLKRLRLPRPRDEENLKVVASERSALWWYIDPDTRRSRGLRLPGPIVADSFVKLFQERASPPADRATASAKPPTEMGARPAAGSGPERSARPAAPGMKLQPAPPPDPDAERQSVGTARPTGHQILPDDVYLPENGLVLDPADLIPEADVEPMRVAYSYSTHAGTRHTINSDGLFLSETPPLFAVADGVGDGNQAMEAARLATSGLVEITGNLRLDALLQEIKGKLGRANSLLFSRQTRPDATPPTASIIVAAMTEGQFLLLWAGDARGYLLRDGIMRPLTRDHVSVGLQKRLRRGIGLEQQFMPEVVSGGIEPGDRLLICSLPLVQVLTERGIAELLLDNSGADGAEQLVQEALIAHVRENVSAIVLAPITEPDAGA